MSILDMGYESTQEGYLRIYLHLKKKTNKTEFNSSGSRVTCWALFLNGEI